jgi:hypothetical protein
MADQDFREEFVKANNSFLHRVYKVSVTIFSGIQFLINGNWKLSKKKMATCW